MKDDDDEFEMLLGEIPHATSSLDRFMNHGYGNEPRVTHKMNVHNVVNGLYGDEVLKSKNYVCSFSSPVSGFSIQSDGSSPGQLSNGGRSISDIGSPSPPQFEDLKAHLIPENGLWLDFMKDVDSNLVDEFNLSRNLSKMYVSDHHESVSVFPNGIQSCDPIPSQNIPMSFDCGSSDNYRRGFSGYGGFNLSVPRGRVDFDGAVGSAFIDNQGIGNLAGSSRYSPSRPRGLIYNSGLSPQFAQTNMMANSNFPMGFGVSDGSHTLNRPSSIGDSFYASRNGMMNSIEAQKALYSSNTFQMASLEENLLHYQPLVPNVRNNVPMHVRVPQESVEAFTRDDSLILQGEGVNYGINSRSRGYNAKGYKPQESCTSTKMFCPFYTPSKLNSLAKAQGYIYHIAKDQHGCRFLQRMFDEGTSRDVQIIFNEIIDHVVELMMNPFGNYLMQKLLEVCDEEQRMLILLKATRERGQLVRISLNTHGTRVVQKLIGTLKMRRQISLVISALEPGFLALIKDLNGNHVIQRCLQCFTTEDNKFIFVAAAKYCVDIATHQHGCCVLQRCINHATGELRQALVAEISANGLLLAQDAYGNYAVQFILELDIPTATAKIISQLEGNFVHLSTLKCGSHVVEKCLVMCNDEVRSKIIHELLSATYFEQLLQDPHANYVVQTALNISEDVTEVFLVICKTSSADGNYSTSEGVCPVVPSVRLWSKLSNVTKQSRAIAHILRGSSLLSF